MNIAVDLDGVIANIIPEILFRLEKDLGIKTDPDTWHTHYIEQLFDEVTKDWVKEQFDDPCFWLNAIPYEDAWLVVNKWFMSGHDIFIVTARNTQGTIDATYRWLEEWEIYFSDLFHSMPRLEKYKVTDKINADLVIEDDPHNAQILSEHLPTFLLDRPYNQDYNIGRTERVSSLWDIDKYIDQWQT